ncbi:MAG: hypothetical protein ACM3NQ_16520 [Bacteroidales bacterium]
MLFTVVTDLAVVAFFVALASTMVSLLALVAAGGERYTPAARTANASVYVALAAVAAMFLVFRVIAAGWVLNPASAGWMQ